MIGIIADLHTFISEAADGPAFLKVIYGERIVGNAVAAALLFKVSNASFILVQRLAGSVLLGAEDDHPEDVYETLAIKLPRDFYELVRWGSQSNIGVVLSTGEKIDFGSISVTNILGECSDHFSKVIGITSFRTAIDNRIADFLLRIDILSDGKVLNISSFDKFPSFFDVNRAA